MAIMNPKQPVSATLSTAEILMFSAFENKLPDTYRVYHSVRWYFFDPNKGKQEGEADFLIFDPDDKILVLEVKGGKNIVYDADQDQWFGNGVKIDDPFKQAQNAEHVFLNQIISNLNITRHIMIGHAVALPDIDAGAHMDLGMDKPRYLILDNKDIGILQARLEEIFEKMGAGGQRSYRFTESERERIHRLIRESREFSSSIRTYFSELNQLVERLTEEQYVILEYLRQHRKAAIKGCAGSGKTLVAIEKAIRLSQAGCSVLFLCNNPYLADDIRRKITDPQITVFDFPNFMKHVMGEFGIKVNVFTRTVPPPRKSWTVFDEPNQAELDAVLGHMTATKTPSFDAVIVDEGQDFQPDWWVVIEACLKSLDDGILYIFFDDRQVMTTFERRNIPINVLEYALSKNCRNTGEIYQLVRLLDNQMPVVSRELEQQGVVQEWIYQPGNEVDLFTKLGSALKDALASFDDPRDVVVLTGEASLLEESRLNGLVFTGSASQASDQETPVKWKAAVLEYLNASFLEDRLSNASVPSKEDIKTINEYSREWCSQHRHMYFDSGRRYPKTDQFSWKMDYYGKLRLHCDGEPISASDRWTVTDFFRDSSWPRTLPRLGTLIRLTPIDEFASFPAYQNIHFTNIQKFKGLEAGAIVFIYKDVVGGYDSQLAASLYVALSRARLQLNIVSPTPMRQEISRVMNQLR